MRIIQISKTYDDWEKDSVVDGNVCRVKEGDILNEHLHSNDQRIDKNEAKEADWISINDGFPSLPSSRDWIAQLPTSWRYESENRSMQLYKNNKTCEVIYRSIDFFFWISTLEFSCSSILRIPSNKKG